MLATNYYKTKIIPIHSFTRSIVFIAYYSDRAQPRINNVRPIEARNARATTLDQRIMINNHQHPLNTCPRNSKSNSDLKSAFSYLEFLEKDPC